MLHVRPNEIGCGEQDHAEDERVEAMEPQLEARVGFPALAELLADVGQREAPRPGAEEGVEVELQPGHARDAGGQRDEGANYRQQAGDEDGNGAAVREEAIGDVELAAAEKDVAAVALHQWASAVVAD